MSGRPSPIHNWRGTLETIMMLLLLLVPLSGAQDILSGQNNFVTGGEQHHKFECGCMEYWTCITR